MEMFSKKERKELQELHKKNIQLFKEAVKEIEEVYADLNNAYAAIDTLTEDFSNFTDAIKPKIDNADLDKMKEFTKKMANLDKIARDAVRDVRDILRSTKKRLKETQRES
jgi:archaellum component FlaC